MPDETGATVIRHGRFPKTEQRREEKDRRDEA